MPLLKKRCSRELQTPAMRSRMIYNVGEFRMELTRLLSPVAEEFAEREADTVIEHLLNLSYSEIRFRSSDKVSRDIIEKSQRIITERLSGKPLPYVLGSAFFYSKEFSLTAETLIPRHDTEHLIAHILENESGSDPLLFLELGTGSGIIPEILTSENDNWKALSVDIFPETLYAAQKNCSPDRVALIASDSFTAVQKNRQFDFIVSNPPYIPHDIVENDLDESVRHFEPHRALDGGEDGLDFYRYLAEVSKEYLCENGRLYLEIGYDQGESVPELLKKNGACDVQVIKDFGGRHRVVSARF